MHTILRYDNGSRFFVSVTTDGPRDPAWDVTGIAVEGDPPATPPVAVNISAGVVSVIHGSA